MSRILCFGELLLRLSPQLGGEWLKHNSMPVFLGGAELNVARALANWQLPVVYSTALPDHYLSREIIAFLEQKQIDASRIQVAGNRIGTYYLPQGADLKSAGVIYDRAYSSFWELKRGQIDWDVVLQDVSWLHFSAISPALNENVADVFGPLTTGYTPNRGVCRLPDRNRHSANIYPKSTGSRSNFR